MLPVLGQGRACARLGVPHRKDTPKACPHLTQTRDFIALMLCVANRHGAQSHAHSACCLPPDRLNCAEGVHPPCTCTALWASFDRRFPDHGICGKKCSVMWCCVDCRGKEGLGQACSSSVCSSGNSILLDTTTPCCLMWFSAMANVAIPGMAVTHDLWWTGCA